jgi:hypothetical protein
MSDPVEGLDENVSAITINARDSSGNVLNATSLIEDALSP